MSGILAVLVLALAGWAGVTGTLLSGRWGLLPLLATREQRARFRAKRPRRRQKSERIPARLRRAVRAADRDRCAHCGTSRTELKLAGREMHVDHIVPWLYGGVTCLWNLALLCDEHNEAKRAYFVREDGSEYRGRSRRDAAAIYRSCLRARRSPLRTARALAALRAPQRRPPARPRAAPRHRAPARR